MITIPFSKPPHCRTGHSRGDRYSTAWEQADTFFHKIKIGSPPAFCSTAGSAVAFYTSCVTL